MSHPDRRVLDGVGQAEAGAANTPGIVPRTPSTSGAQPSPLRGSRRGAGWGTPTSSGTSVASILRPTKSTSILRSGSRLVIVQVTKNPAKPPAVPLSHTGASGGIAATTSIVSGNCSGPGTCVTRPAGRHPQKIPVGSVSMWASSGAGVAAGGTPSSRCQRPWRSAQYSRHRPATGGGGV